MKEVATLVPALRGYENLQPAFEINASGPADRLDVQLNVREKERRSGRRRSHRRRVGSGAAHRRRRCKPNTSTSAPLVRRSATVQDRRHRPRDDGPGAARRRPTPLRGTYTVNATRANRRSATKHATSWRRGASTGRRSRLTGAPPPMAAARRRWAPSRRTSPAASGLDGTRRSRGSAQHACRS